MATNVLLTPGTLPQGYCFTGLQQYYNDIIGLTLAQIPGSLSLFNFGANVPDPADQDKPWIRTNADGTLEGIYTYSGVWSRPHPVPAGDNERRIWVGTEAQLWSYDGGDGTDPAAATDTTGSMWAIDTAFDFRFPVGAGTNATTYDGNPASTIAVKGTGGAERHVLLEAELPEHTHVLANNVGNANSTPIAAGEYASANGRGDVDDKWCYALSKSLGDESPNVGKVGETGTDASHQNMPPYYGVRFIKRSSRIYYTVT